MINPVDVLYQEHEIIKKVIDEVRNVVNAPLKNASEYEKTILEAITFFKTYADKYHHLKEEEILFPAMVQKSELLESGVIKEMLDNHEDFRLIISNIEKSLSEKKYAEVKLLILKYTEALLDHIAVENDEVFQMALTLFSDKELEDVYYRFCDSDRELDEARVTKQQPDKAQLEGISL